MESGSSESVSLSLSLLASGARGILFPLPSASASEVEKDVPFPLSASDLGATSASLSEFSTSRDLVTFDCLTTSMGISIGASNVVGFMVDLDV